MESDVRVFADLHELSMRAGEAATAVINDAVQRAGRCSLALSGGDTPRTLYRLLASQFRDQIPWENVHMFWGDDRYVPHEHPLSNFRMAKELLLDYVPCPPANVHPMPTHLESADDAARDYEITLRKYFTGHWPQFDLNILGIGDDGHTASLFPGSPALTETKRWVAAVETPAVPPLRLTLTLPAITHSAHAYVLVAGEKKAKALASALAGEPDAETVPASGIRLNRGATVWWVDGNAGDIMGLKPRRIT